MEEELVEIPVDQADLEPKEVLPVPFFIHFVHFGVT